MIILEKKSQFTLYEQIYQQLRDQILEGTLSTGSKLSSTRSLAEELQVSRNTVEAAYQQLCSEGYISSRSRSGYHVEKIEGRLLESQENTAAPQIHSPNSPVVRRDDNIDSLINFQYGCLHPKDFPERTFRRILNLVQSSDEYLSIVHYGQRTGDPRLKAEIAAYLQNSRGVKCRPEQIILCAGTLSCLSLIAQLLLRHGNRIALEEPCYDSVRCLFQNHGYSVLPVPVEKNGVSLSLLKKHSCTAAYITPSHQFPTGAVLPINKRLELLDWAEQAGVYLIEDDYDSELRYSSRPLPSLQSLDRRGRVIYLNTFSKSLAPGLRFSFMVLPEPLLKEYNEYFSRYNCSLPLLEQLMVYHFIREGHWTRHLRKISLSNKKRHESLVTAISEVFGKRAVIHGGHAGLHVLLEVRNGDSEAVLIEKARSAGAAVYPVSIHYAQRAHYSDNMVLVGFSGLSEKEIEKGIQLMEHAWFPS